MPREPEFLTEEDALRFRAKRELRKRMRALRAALPARAIADRSSRIAAQLLAHEAWRGSHTVALFMSLPDEVQLGAVIAAARAGGKAVALPVVGDAGALAFRAPYAGGIERALVTSAFGIAEPGVDAPAVAIADVELFVVPALAIDPRGHRIGYGGGYYDRALASASARARSIGLAFDFQLIAEVPQREGDVPVQWIVTDARVMRAERVA